MKLVDIQEVSKDDFSLASQSERDTHIVGIHGIVIGLKIEGGGGVTMMVVALD